MSSQFHKQMARFALLARSTRFLARATARFSLLVTALSRGVLNVIRNKLRHHIIISHRLVVFSLIFDKFQFKVDEIALVPPSWKITS